MAKSTKIWDGTNWQDLQGPPGPTAVSTDAGNLTKLGTDGKVFTSVKASDVAGLGTISLKAAGDYLPITGGTLTGPVRVVVPGDSVFDDLEVSGPTSSLGLNVIAPGGGVAIYFRQSGAVSKLECQADGVLRHYGNKEFEFQSGFPVAVDKANNRTITLGPKASADAGNLTKIGTDGYLYTSVSASDVTGLGTIALKNTGDYLPITGGNVTGLVEIGDTAGRHIDIVPTAPNITVHGFDATARINVLSPTATGASAALISNKVGVPLLALGTTAQTWQLSVQAGGMFAVYPSNPTGNPAFQATRGATDAASAFTANYPFRAAGGVSDGIEFNNTSLFGDRLDAYEEGNWVPSYAGDGIINATYSVAKGSYTRIGRMVHCVGYLQLAALAARSSGTLKITGLPFPMQDGSGCTGSVGVSSGWGNKIPVSVVSHNTELNSLMIYDAKSLIDGFAGALPVLDTSALTPNSLLLFSVTYFTNT
jgi:hypothetical protein